MCLSNVSNDVNYDLNYARHFDFAFMDFNEHLKHHQDPWKK